MILFDEKSFAERMHDTQSFVKAYGIGELSIYARWLKYNKLQEIGKDYLTVTDEELQDIEKYIESALIDFASKHYSEFNYTNNYVEIDAAIANTRDRKLLIPKKIPITRNEYEKLLEIENDDYRRIIFVMLVESKYFRFNNVSMVDMPIDENTMFFVRMSYEDVMKVAKVKNKNEVKKKSMYYLYQNDYFGRTVTKDLFFVKIVDTDQNPDDVVEWIFDYDHLDLHYERLFTDKVIGICKYCGCLFRQNKFGNALFCYKHRGYNKKGLRFGKCIDCGKEFSVSANDKNKVRCDDCQKKKLNNDTRLRMQKYRNK